MALGADYVTTAELKAEFGIGDFDDESELDLSVAAASRWVTSYCERDFNVAASATARVFDAATPHLVRVDDISTTTGLIVKTDLADDGTYETTIPSTDYQLEPLNGVSDGMTGWPYTCIRLVEPPWFTSARRAQVQVTATWGWAAVPDAVKKATMIQAARLFKRRYSPEGILGGSEQFGAVRVGSRLDPDVQALLAPYRRHAVLIA